MNLNPLAWISRPPNLVTDVINKDKYTTAEPEDFTYKETHNNILKFQKVKQNALGIWKRQPEWISFTDHKLAKTVMKNDIDTNKRMDTT